MTLTDNQKKWCESINKGQISSSESFLKYLGFLKCNYDESKVLEEFFSDNTEYIKDYEFDFSVRDIHYRMNEFLSLWSFLEKENMVISSPTMNNIFSRFNPNNYLDCNLSFEEQKQKKKELAFIIIYNLTFRYNDYAKKGIYPLSPLGKFILNKFKTDKEIELLRSKKNTIWAICISGVLALFSLIVSIYAINKAPETQPIRIINLDSALVKVSRSPLYRGGAQDSLSKVHSPSAAVVARDGKKTGK